MTEHTPFWQRLRRFVGIKSSDEIDSDMKREPYVKKAEQALEKSNRVMREFEALERRKTHR